MMKTWFWFFILMSAFQVNATEVFRRSVGFDWDPIPESRSYDMEIRVIKNGVAGKIFSFKIPSNSWNGKLSPAHYEFRVRSRDFRGVPGDWSAFNAFNVGLENVVAKTPKDQISIASQSEKTNPVKFSWNAVGAAKKYKFELTSKDGKTKIEKETSDLELTLELPVAQDYEWKVAAFSEEDLPSDSSTASRFSLVGQRLKSPDILVPENKYVREMIWNQPHFADKYDLAFSHYNSQLKKWDRIQSINDYTDQKMIFPPNWSGGKWKIQIRAKSTLRASSEVSQLVFNVAGGDRSPAAEYVATVRKSIDRIEGWFGTASYFLTLVDYHSLMEFSSAVGGTGNLGLGWFSESSAWGFHSSAEMSGFLADGRNYTYSSIEASAIHRQHIRDTDEMRLSAGLAMHELPVLLTPEEYTAKQQAIFLGSSFDQSAGKISALGPQFGFEYWHSLSPKLGLQVNTHLYYSLLKMSLPAGGESNKPALSLQYGLMGSYRVNSKFTGLMGMTYKEDNLEYSDSYGSTTGQPAVPTSIKTTVKGYFFSLYAEYTF